MRIEPEHAPYIGQLPIEATAKPLLERCLDPAGKACLAQDRLQGLIELACRVAARCAWADAMETKRKTAQTSAQKRLP